MAWVIALWGLLIGSLLFYTIPPSEESVITPKIDAYIPRTVKPPSSDTSSLVEANRAIKSDLKRFLLDLSATYGLDYDLLNKIIVCESNWRTDVWSFNLSSFGIAQYTRPTFDENCKGSYSNPYDQLTCFALMAHRGMLGRWDCWKIIYNYE